MELLPGLEDDGEKLKDGKRKKTLNKHTINQTWDNFGNNSYKLKN